MPQPEVKWTTYLVTIADEHEQGGVRLLQWSVEARSAVEAQQIGHKLRWRSYMAPGIKVVSLATHAIPLADHLRCGPYRVPRRATETPDGRLEVLEDAAEPGRHFLIELDGAHRGCGRLDGGGGMVLCAHSPPLGPEPVRIAGGLAQELAGPRAAEMRDAR